MKAIEENKLYTVRYSRRVNLDTQVFIIFATYDEHFAKKYVRKFNRILSEAKEYWKDYKIERYYMFPEDHKHYERFYSLLGTYDAYYLETEIR